MQIPLIPSRMLAGIVVLGTSVLLAFSDGGMVEEHDLPSSLSAGERAVCTWMLDIHDIAGFARFQVQFPSGVNVEPVGIENASFTMDKGRAKLIWLDLPDSDVLTIQLAISANAAFEGGEVKQWFSFIREGSRVDVEFEPHIISLGAAPLSAISTEKKVDLRPSRIWNREGPDVGVMTVRVENIEPGQFVKIEEFMPNPYATEAVTSGNADIVDSFEQTQLYVWQAAPMSGVIEIEYRIMGVDPMAEPSIQGKLHTTHGNQLVTISIPALAGFLAEAIPAQVAEIVPEASSTGKDNGRQTQSKKDAASAEPKRKENGQIQYRVQLLAGPNRVETRTIQKQYSFTDSIAVETDQDWMKYTTGDFDQYNQARNERVRLRRDFSFPGPFVTAYNNDRRITVQEALLLTQQNWIP